MNKIKGINSITHGELIWAWILFWQNSLHQFYDKSFQPPLFISEDILRTSKYFHHFPQHLFRLRDRKKFSSQFVTPATCLHVYPDLRNKQIKHFATLGTAHCARYENGNWKAPYRLQDFHMTELVVIGKENMVSKEMGKVKKVLERIFTDFGFSGAFQNATDAFFLDQGEGAKIIQQMKELKQEYVVKDNGVNVALASINNHDDFFGKCFNIRSVDVFASSFCAAFGIERLATHSLKVWGDNQQNWPSLFRKHVKIS